MKDIFEELNYVIKKGAELKNRFFLDSQAFIDLVTIFTTDDKEYSALKEKAKTIGKARLNDDEGIYVELKEPFTSEEIRVDNIRITPPRDGSIMRGAITYVAENFSEFKEKFSSLNSNLLVKEANRSTLELIYHDHDVLLYITPSKFSQLNDKSIDIEFIVNKVGKIVDESIKLRKKYINENINMELDHVAIFTHSDEEYQKYTEQIFNVGKVLLENSTGVYLTLNEDIESNDGQVKVLKFRKPDEIHTEEGSVDYLIHDYPSFRKKYSTLKHFKVTRNALGIELIMIKDNEFSTVASFLSKSVKSFFITDIPVKESNEKSTEEVVKLESVIEEEKTARIQLMADFQNFKKRVEIEKATWGAIANISLIQEILEIYDDLEMAKDDGNLTLETSKQSIKNAQDKILESIKKAGIEKVEVKVGDDFDKEKMEAVSAVHTDDDNQKGKVIAVISSAYKYSDREGILKPAKVVVKK